MAGAVEELEGQTLGGRYRLERVIEIRRAHV